MESNQLKKEAMHQTTKSNAEVTLEVIFASRRIEIEALQRLDKESIL